MRLRDVDVEHRSSIHLWPYEDLPIVTRELIYTGVTRARTGVAIVGSRNLLVAAGKRRALRYSGLANRLRAEIRS